ncbi:PRC-barrel domain-containing protein [Hyphomicrobium sp.]|uniref:PRC-barrel domain-containing protein n=1 Tax=Hyphomicrobium sp. TaxID=82 RepID=UPI002B8022FB|nr:PRC-barrel domain-containing protein [Hyphomicrobium sp.]HVZ03798.1 PRC-barrel domain-containing protein [Hyphomicrobium sp.]
MRTARVILLGGFILGSVAPSMAETNAAPKPAAEKAVTPEPTGEKPKQAAKDRPSSNEGTPAVVVDDNKVENLLGRDVKSAAGEKLGQITDVIVGRTGDVRAAVIDFGGFLGVGSRKVAVAWNALKFSKDAIVVDMTRDQLRVTPEYRPGEPIVVVGVQHDQTSSPAAPADKPAAK